ncbi:unnamed protein product [marine sediment metagenome]|uniref:Uncharacterized protein n=1 Tax=marine sediment metagenome TaxID=412755 RepID=X1QLF0_9ZZZZ
MASKKFTKVEARVNTYLAEHKGVSYKEACFAVLDSSDGLGETERNPFLRPGGGLSMPERKRRTEENIEDVQRISNIINRRIKKNRKNPYLRANGGFSLIEKFPEYKDRKKWKIKR